MLLNELNHLSAALISDFDGNPPDLPDYCLPAVCKHVQGYRWCYLQGLPGKISLDKLLRITGERAKSLLWGEREKWSLFHQISKPISASVKIILAAQEA